MSNLYTATTALRCGNNYGDFILEHTAHVVVTSGGETLDNAILHDQSQLYRRIRFSEHLQHNVRGLMQTVRLDNAANMSDKYSGFKPAAGSAGMRMTRILLVSGQIRQQ